jgi:hypothetical protein
LSTKKRAQGINLGFEGVHTPGAASKDSNGYNACLARACHHNLTGWINVAVERGSHAAHATDVFVVY